MCTRVSVCVSGWCEEVGRLPTVGVPNNGSDGDGQVTASTSRWHATRHEGNLTYHPSNAGPTLLNLQSFVYTRLT